MGSPAGAAVAAEDRPQTIVGKTAEVVVQCRPSGEVRVQGELWEARCAAGADIGEDVRITAVEELTLVVEPAHAASTSPRGSRILDGSG